MTIIRAERACLKGDIMAKQSLKIQRFYNEGGPSVAVTSKSVLEVDGLYFRDAAGKGTLLPYEDWRLSAKERAQDLAERLSVTEIAGLMMYSPHQTVPSYTTGPFTGTYDGKSIEDTDCEGYELTDQQKKFLHEDHVRHVLAATLRDPETAARWNNELQAFVEKEDWGIPANISSDPRHSAASAGVEFKGGSTGVSVWPDHMGISATFDPETAKQFAEAVREEYRALGISTALSPQVDLATEPRWMRFEDTFGTNPAQVTEMSKIYIDGLQTTVESETGWGNHSVAAMAKHWPGGGPCEAGRDAHYPFGKFAVYPGNNLKDHLKPFLDGAFKLDGATGSTASIMPYYSVSWGVDTKDGLNVGNSYSHYIIHDLLREKYGYDGVICTDWGITADPSPDIDSFSSRCFGVEDLTEAQRHFRCIDNGVDQFGGNSNIVPILEAYKIGVEKYGEEKMRARFEESAVRLLTNMFRCGLFDDPYLDVEHSLEVVGCKKYAEEGYKAQLKSVVMVKNKEHTLPVKEEGKKKVYIPIRHIREQRGFFRNVIPAHDVNPVSDALVNEYFERVDTPEEADLAIIFIESPSTDGHSPEDAAAGGNGYLPISLQYRPYTADTAREVSIGGGDFREPFTNRSYKGKTNYAHNEADLDLVIDTKKAMGDKPVIVSLRMHNPTIPAEFEPYADAILVNFGLQAQALFDLILGKSEPCGLLPVQMPKNMETVEAHCEDVPFDIEPYTDSEGHVYDYGYGLNWEGEIKDGRADRYRK